MSVIYYIFHRYRPVARLNYGGGGGSFGPKWNSSLRKWPLWLITFCLTDNLRVKYLDILALFQGLMEYIDKSKSTSYSKFS